MENFSLDCIAGYEKEKEELAKIIDILNNRKTYYSKGGYIPKGLILYGEPGNGKTLFAKVLASETHVKFYEFDLAKPNISIRLQRIFKVAKRNTPAIIFIDEISRLVNNNSFESDETRQNLNTLLSLIDGFQSDHHRGIFIVATTNDYDEIPDALVRSGRIDKKIRIDSPNASSRRQIIEYYMAKTSCIFDVSMDKIVKLTANMSVAEIKTLINECVLDSDKDNHVSEEVLTRKVNFILEENLETDVTMHDEKIIAIQELGKFVVARSLKNGEYILNINQDGSSKGTIFSSCEFENSFFDDDDYFDDDDEDEEDDEYYDDEDEYHDKLSPTTLTLEEEVIQNEIFSVQDFEDNLMMDLGKIAAIDLILKERYSSSYNTLRDVYGSVRMAMQSGFYGFEYIYPYGNDTYASNSYMEKVEQMTNSIIKKVYDLAYAIVKEHLAFIEAMVPLLMKNKIMEAKDVEPIYKEWRDSLANKDMSKQ